MRRDRAFLLVALSVGCGPALRSAAALDAELRPGLDGARTGAPAEVAAAEEAIERAENAEAQGEVDAGADYRTEARLLAAIATERAAHAELVETHAALEAEATELLTEAIAIEAEVAVRETEASRRAAAGAAREEALRAWARADVDELRGRRAARLSLDDARAMREAATTIRRRARLLAAAAHELDPTSGAEERAEAERLLALSEADEDPLASLRHADEAHRTARALLGAARRGRPIDEATVRSLLEAADSEGFVAVRLERGVAITVAELLEASGARLSRTAGPRLARLAALLVSYPEGPVRLEVAGASALQAALVEAGVPAARVVLGEPSGAARVVLVAYVPADPSTATRLTGSAPTSEGAAVEAHPTPSSSSE